MSKEIQRGGQPPLSKTAERNAASVAHGGTMKDYFSQENIQQSLAAVMPAHLKPKRLMKMLLGAINKTPKLMEVSKTSMYQAAMTLSSLGLEPNSPLGHAYLIPFGKEVQLIIGYRGYIELARRSGRIKSIRARVRRENEKFEIKMGLREDLVHEYKGDTSSSVTHFYAVAEFVDGGYHFEVMTRAEVDAIRKRSKSANSGPWVTDYEEMGKKTVTKRLAKWLPISEEMADAMAADNDGDVVDSTAVPVAPPAPNLSLVEGESPPDDDVEATTSDDAATATNPETGEEEINPIEREFLEAKTQEELYALAAKHKELVGPDREAVNAWYRAAKERMEK